MSNNTSITCTLPINNSSASGNCPFVGKVIGVKKKKKKSFVPLGIPKYGGEEQKKGFRFSIKIRKSNIPIDKIKVEILNKNDGSVVFEEEITDNTKLSEGKHDWQWDGFNKNDILDTSFLKATEFEIKVTAFSGSQTTSDMEDFKIKKTKAKWIDIKIDRNVKYIIATVRLNLRDGGARIGASSKVPPGNVSSTRPIITSRTQSFGNLVRYVQQGVNTVWGQSVTIHGVRYSVQVLSNNTTTKSMHPVKLVYNTNNKYLGSSNPGPARDPVSFIATFLTPDRISYNVGHIKYSNGWGHESDPDETQYYKSLSAHEIGHAIVLAFAGSIQSYIHNGASNIFQMRNGTPYPTTGDIDIMHFSYHKPSTIPVGGYDHRRVKAREKDVKGMLWLSKIKYK